MRPQKDIHVTHAAFTVLDLIRIPMAGCIFIYLLYTIENFNYLKLDKKFDTYSKDRFLFGLSIALFTMLQLVNSFLYGSEANFIFTL